MTTLILIDTKAFTVRRIVDKAIGPAFHLDRNGTRAELLLDIENLRENGEPKEEVEVPTVVQFRRKDDPKPASS